MGKLEENRFRFNPHALPLWLLSSAGTGCWGDHCSHGTQSWAPEQHFILLLLPSLGNMHAGPLAFPQDSLSRLRPKAPTAHSPQPTRAVGGTRFHLDVSVEEPL